MKCTVKRAAALGVFRQALWIPFALLACVLTVGCVSTPALHHVSPQPGLFPAEGLLVQRAIFTGRGHQYPINGYLALSETRGKRLVITENFGQVVADVLIKPDGRVFVMQSSRMFPRRYIRRLVASDVQCVFGGEPELETPVAMVDTNHFRIDRGKYQVDIRIVERKPGPQPDAMFDETKIKK